MNNGRSYSHDTNASAYERGEQANYDGEPLSVNPYWAAGDLRAAWWTNGWLAANVVREEWEADNYARAAA